MVVPKTTMSSAIPATPSHPSKVCSNLVCRKDVLCHIQPKGHAVESVSTKRGVERGEVTGLLVEDNVPVPAVCVYNGEDCTSSQFWQDLF